VLSSILLQAHAMHTAGSWHAAREALLFILSTAPLPLTPPAAAAAAAAAAVACSGAHLGHVFDDGELNIEAVQHVACVASLGMTAALFAAQVVCGAEHDGCQCVWCVGQRAVRSCKRALRVCLMDAVGALC
jgi:hypothetical protein